MAQSPKIAVHVDRPRFEVSKRLYGVFFEEINHAGMGGLYGELIRNRDFRERPVAPKGIVGWALGDGATASPLDEGQGVLVEATKDTYLSNSGWYGIGVRPGDKLRLRVRAKAGRAFALRAALVARNGSEIAVCDVRVTSGMETSNSELVAAKGDAEASLRFSVPANARLELEYVSLFPSDTFLARENGMRSDLALKVAALRPSFVRFPGGCYVEGGDKLANAFRWKDSIGPLELRKGHLNDNWGYWCSYGLGYHEYLQWCEDLNADAMFVINCGLSHKEQVPMDQLGPWVQDALDAVEYAIGPVSSKWGAERAKNGHPAPFPLRYVEIGNENGLWEGFGGGPKVYAERYRHFYDALRAKYPQIELIANTRGEFQAEIVDDHYYNSAEWFWANSGLYDHADRKGPKVYVGEYAVTQGCGLGNLKAALGEAAFLIGLERNSDHVIMSSYAPLFVHEKDRRWNPDAIVFNSANSYGTPSYHVQQMFAANRPDVTLATTYPEIKAGISRGGVGLGAWRTQVEYKDLVVVSQGKEVFRSSPGTSDEKWKAVSGQWSMAGGTIRQDRLEENARNLLQLPGLADAQDYTLTVKARKLSGDEGFLILLRARDGDNFIWWNLGGWGNTLHAVERSAGGGKIRLGRGVAGKIETDRWYEVQLVAKGPTIECFLDGQLIERVTDEGGPSFIALGGLDREAGQIVLKVVNGADEDRETDVELIGADPIVGNATVWTLTGSSLADENSFASPKRIVPKKSVFRVGSKHFRHRFPARSVTVLRIPYEVRRSK